MRQKFYAASNGIFYKVGCRCDAALLISLINQFCLPVLLYAAEAINWSVKNLNRCHKAQNSVFAKIFNTYDTYIINCCKYYMYVLPIDLQVELYKLKFYYKLCVMYKTSTFLKECAWNELVILLDKFNIKDWCKPQSFKFHIWSYFEKTLFNN